MEMSRISNCWYISTCKDDCNTCQVYQQMKWQMDNSGLPTYQQASIQLAITPNNEVDRRMFGRLADIRKNITEFVDNGENLYICSKYCGNGKTSWAVKMLHTLFHYRAVGNYDNLQGMFVSVPDLLLKLKDFNNPLSSEYKERLQSVPLVIWDDIAISGISQYDYNQIYTLINNRIFSGKSNIYTSNCNTEKSLETILGTRLTSRIWNTSEIIELKGVDMR